MHWRRSSAVGAESFGAFAVSLGAELSSRARVLHRTVSRNGLGQLKLWL